MHTKHDTVVVAAFQSARQARLALDDLRDASFSSRDIGILTHDEDGDPDVRSLKDMSGSHAGKGAATGAAVGAGGGALWALGIAAGVLPAIGPVIAGGTLAAIAASAATGAAAGTVIGALTGLGVSDEDAAYYDEEFRKGRTIVVVDADERAGEALDLLKRHGAYRRGMQHETVTHAPQ